MSTAPNSPNFLKDQPLPAQPIKPDSFKRCATSLLSKFSLASIKPEQVLRRRGSISSKKQSIENKTIHDTGDESPIKTSAHNPQYRIQPVTMLSELGQEVQAAQHPSTAPTNIDVQPYFKSNLSIDTTEHNANMDIRPNLIRQKSISTPLKTSISFIQALDKSPAAVDCVGEGNPGLFYIHSNSTSDDEEVTTPTTSTLCTIETWSSTDEGVESSMKFFARTNGSVDLTNCAPNKRIVMNPMYRQQVQKRNTLCFNDNNFSKSHDCTGSDSLDRSTSTNSSSSASSSGSVSAKCDKKEVKSGKSEVQKKMLKANTMWRINIQTQLKKTCEKKQISKSKDKLKDQAIVRFIINELYSTEKSFHQFLLFIRSNYMEPMQIASQSKNPLVKPNDIYVLFNPLLELITMSQVFLVKLEDYVQGLSLQDMNPDMAIGYIFKELEHYFGVFLKYAVHYRCHLKAIRRASNTGYILKIDRKSKALKKENNRLGLADYLIAPFQRVPRYGLLIKDLLRHTEANLLDDYQTNNLIYAQNIIDGLAITMNQVLEEKNSKSPFLSSFYPFNTQALSSYTA
ncbi:hypothetical protein INT48_009500 [Thamnidium elegans]|uniref:DH domain-containing protein n=1 Tax=Thamnidium elegans TaxID=101142 RepID=A0A8H7T032_9FUNG|nr:hypothetical protein INT48_009500 [Thamnidium elegans]